MTDEKKTDARGDCESIYEECANRFTQLDRGQQRIEELLRGVGPDPGLVGHVSAHASHIKGLRKTLYGDGDREGLATTVDRLDQSKRTTSKITAAILTTILAAAILAVAASLIRLWASHQITAPPAAAASATAEATK